MLRRTYDWVMAQAEKPRAMVVLAAVAFAEASFFPIPHLPLMAPMILARRDAAWRIAALATVASVLGGIFGYCIGYFLYETVGQPLLALIGKADAFAHFSSWNQKYGIWVVFAGGFTPLPYKVVTIISGAVKLNFWLFMIGSVLSRGGLMFGVAALFYWGGAPMRAFIERYLGLLTAAFFLLLLGGFLLLQVL